MSACFSPHAPVGVACAPNDTCPSGQTCVDGVCGGAPSDAAIVVDADAPLGDAIVDAPTQPMFGAPVRLAALCGPDADYSPSLTPDELTVFLNIYNEVTDDSKIYTATRASKAQAFGPLAPVPATDLLDLEFHPDVSSTGLELIYISDVPPEGLRRVGRTSTLAPWGTPTVPGVEDIESPDHFANDLRMMVAENSSIAEYRRADVNAAWTFVRNHMALTTHRLPGISADGLEIFTVSSAGRLHRATRVDIGQPFGNPARVSIGGAFDTGDIVDPELSADGKTLYFSADIGAATGYDIFMMTR